MGKMIENWLTRSGNVQRRDDGETKRGFIKINEEKIED